MAPLDVLGTYIESMGVEVILSYREKDEDRGGVFFYAGRGGRKGPAIEVVRPRSEQSKTTLDWAPTEAQQEEALFILAHEFGHCLSWRADGARYEAFFAAYFKFKRIQQFGAQNGEALSVMEAELIDEEEARAWALGREHVPEELRTSYDSHAEEKVSGYRQGLRGVCGG
jgi:hypothetical protein